MTEQEQQEQYVYFNGKIIPRSQAALDISDTGFLHGAGVFTTLRSHNGKAFRLDEHINRLISTADKIGIRYTVNHQVLTKAVEGVLEANNLSEARIRITLTPGPVGQDNPTALITAAPLEPYPRSWYEKGISVITSAVKQYSGDPTTGLKTSCYLSRILARQAAAAAGADEALWYTEENLLAEACFCNVFLVRDGQLWTPPLETPVLAGITRQVVLELAEKLNIAYHDNIPLKADDLMSAEEVFLTSSTAGIRPVVVIDRQPVGDEKPGPITKKLIAAYEQLLEQQCPAEKDKST